MKGVYLYILLHMLITPLRLNASSPEGLNSWQTYNPETLAQYDGQLAYDPMYTYWDVNQMDELLGPNTDDSTSYIEASDTSQTIMHSDTTPNEETTGHHERKRRERKGQYFLDRELAFARAKMNPAKMSWDHWQELLLAKDADALGIKKEYDTKCDWEKRYYLIKRKLKRKPNDTQLLAELEGLKLMEKNRVGEKPVYGKGLPMSKSKKERVNRLIRKINIDVQDYRTLNRFRTRVLSVEVEREREKKRLAEGKKVVDAKYAAGDAFADEIAVKLEQYKRLIRQAPLDGNVWGGLLQEINKLMQWNHREHTPLENPLGDEQWSIVGNSETSRGDLEGDCASQGEDDDVDWTQYLTDECDTIPCK